MISCKNNARYWPLGLFYAKMPSMKLLRCLLISAILLFTAMSPLWSQDSMFSDIEISINGHFYILLSAGELENLSFQDPVQPTRRRLPLSAVLPFFDQVSKLEIASSASQAMVSVDNFSPQLSAEYLEWGPDGLRLNSGNQSYFDVRSLQIYGRQSPEKTLVVWLPRDWEQSFLLSYIERFQRYRGVRVQVFVVDELLQMMMRQGTRAAKLPRPDVLLLRANEAQALQSLLEPLDRSFLQQKPLEFTQLFTIYNNDYSASLLAYPFSFASYKVFYNRQNLALARKPKLSELFWALGQQGQKVAYASPYILSLLLSSFTDDWEFSQAQNILSLNTPSIRQGLSYLADLPSKGILDTEPNAIERFRSGEVGALFASSDQVGQLRHMELRLKEDLASIPLPFNDLSNQNLRNVSKVYALGLLRESTAQDEGLALIHYLSSWAVQNNFDLSQGWYPANQASYGFYQASQNFVYLQNAWQEEVKKPFSRQEKTDIEGLNKLMEARWPLLFKHLLTVDQVLSDLNMQLANGPGTRRVELPLYK